ncbi:MAG TPA: C25 family cysteine peptidase, partial [Anaerolineae bacterium]|nr:C25 family cysteine peptidase [Anaerolineae bacterium]
GYLLIVGEVEVIPSWRETGWDLDWPNWNCTTHEVHLTDLPYARRADDDAPSLIVGRIIGNEAADLSRALGASDGFDRSDALLVSGFDFKDEYEDLFVDFIDDAEDLIDSEYSVKKLHWSKTPLGKVADFREGSANSDLIVYQGHGHPDRWAGLDGTDFAGDAQAPEPTPPISFGSEHPIVLGWACLTGSYEDHEADAACGASDIGDYGIVEAFFDHGAAVYVGATEVASIPHNVVGAKALFDLWEPDKSIGYALTAVKRDMLRRHPGDAYWLFWVTEYNLYGDPKYGATQAIRPSLTP